jgi:molybdopterin-guanine dinucleotide biosynthesis protein A
MGRDKALLPLGTQPLWQRQLDTLRLVSGSTWVSARTTPAWLPREVPFQPDATGVDGPLAGLIASLEHANARGIPGIGVLAVDLPDVSPRFLRRLWQLRPPGGGIVAEGPHGFEPLCAVYPVSALPLLREQAAARDWKLQSAVQRLLAAGLLRSHTLAPEDVPVMRNVNTPDDLTPGPPA